MPVKSNVLKTNKLKEPPPGQKRRKKSTPVKSRKRFFNRRQVQQVFGLFIILLSIFLGIAYGSYLDTWKPEDTVFNMKVWDILTSGNVTVHNLMGKLGAVSAYYSIKKGFGVAAYLFLFFFLMAGIKLLLPKSNAPVWKTFQIVLIGILWFPATFAYVMPNVMDGIFPGTFGIFVENWLVNYLGKPGTGLILFFVLIVFLIVIGFFTLFNFKIPSFKLFGRNGKNGKEKNGNGKQRREDKYNVEEYAVDEEDEDDDDENEKIRKDKGINSMIGKKTNGTNKVLPNPLQKSGSPNVIELDPGIPVRERPLKNSGSVDFTIENPTDISDTQQVKKEEPPKPTSTTIKSRYGVESLYDPRLDLPHYQFPTFDLLNDYGSDKVNVRNEELIANKQKIVETLNHYSIDIEKIKATIGPTVTLYEIIPAPGIRISRIRNLEDDIALSLSALGIRIIAPIPGKGTVGIEVPNQNPDIVSMKSILASEKFQESKAELPFGMGKTVSNEVFIADLTKMPHILMAGATGQGKSVGLNAVITSLLYKKHPAELKFVMVDPKKVELTLFSKIERHYLAKLPDSEEAIITDTRKVVRTLNSLGIEMDTRYELLKDAQVRNIKEYNSKFLERKLNPTEGHHFMPYIVLVIDEFADLIMTAGKEIEIPLTRLAQLARAVGIHLIIATQRPSVNIITGSIKANFPARVAFRVISKVDSRTILDSPGADQLIGRGDMLLSTGSDLIRLQCAFIDTPEIDRLTEFIGSQRAYPDAYHLPEFSDEQDEHITEFDPSEKDQLFEDSARILVQTQQGSTSLLQRKLKIGYNRAGRIIDQLEGAGIVGPFEGSKAREVLIKTELDLEQFLKNMDNNFNGK
ncbi:MAG: DNA translocase FtsK 4TM domain-containing protein [Bacteroidales bacterium]|nr:DNA translocase FtsK 4TM domain-containing protein [Bacteroidales bacterium]